MSSRLHSEKETTLAAEQIRSEERSGLLGTEVFTFSWGGEKCGGKEEGEEKTTREVTIQCLVWN